MLSHTTATGTPAHRSSKRTHREALWFPPPPSASLTKDRHRGNRADATGVVISPIIHLRVGQGRRWIKACAASTGSIRTRSKSLPDSFTAMSRARCRGILGPGMINFNFMVATNFHMRERWRAQFRWETFNTFNTPNSTCPTSLGGGSLGVVTSGRPPHPVVRLEAILLKLFTARPRPSRTPPVRSNTPAAQTGTADPPRPSPPRFAPHS